MTHVGQECRFCLAGLLRCGQRFRQRVIFCHRLAHFRIDHSESNAHLMHEIIIPLPGMADASHAQHLVVFYAVSFRQISIGHDGFCFKSPPYILRIDKVQEALPVFLIHIPLTILGKSCMVREVHSYTPSHTVVLYTNHLPKVGAKDAGIWRRLIVIPFDAKIEGKSDIKNYSDYLFRNAGGAILSWVIEGAADVIKHDFKIPLPECVQRAIKQYREDNDWLGHFLNERCEIGSSLQVKSGELYSAYRTFCADTGEYTRSTTDFYNALENEGFTRQKLRNGSFVTGLALGTKADVTDDFLE